MIQFYATLTIADDAQLKQFLDNKVQQLQRTFGERHCECHPNYQWAAGLTWNDASFGITPVTTDVVKPCNFLNDITEREILPYLQ